MIHYFILGILSDLTSTFVTFRVRECSSSRFDSGWNIRGSDYGCCGNYEGCCTFASDACYTHDHQCRCCDLSWYCLSGCVPDPSC